MEFALALTGGVIVAVAGIGLALFWLAILFADEDGGNIPF